MSKTLFFSVLHESIWLLEIDWVRTKDIVGVLKDAITAAAIVLGGIWTYFNFIKGRIYRPRLEPGICGKVFRENGITFVISKAELKNIGLSKVDIKQMGLAIIVHSYQVADTASITTADKTQLATFPVFENHEWIEPGELIKDEQLFQVPEYKGTGIRVELRFVYNGIEWNAGSVAELSCDAERTLTPGTGGALEPVITPNERK
jgi:hypothetical protein